MFMIDFLAPADKKITVKDYEKGVRYRDLIRKPRLPYPKYAFKISFFEIGALGDAKPSLVRNLQSHNRMSKTCRGTCEIDAESCHSLVDPRPCNFILYPVATHLKVVICTIGVIYRGYILGARVIFWYSSCSQVALRLLFIPLYT